MSQIKKKKKYITVMLVLEIRMYAVNIYHWSKNNYEKHEFMYLNILLLYHYPTSCDRSLERHTLIHIK